MTFVTNREEKSIYEFRGQQIEREQLALPEVRYKKSEIRQGKTDTQGRLQRAHTVQGLV